MVHLQLTADARGSEEHKKGKMVLSIASPAAAASIKPYKMVPHEEERLGEPKLCFNKRSRIKIDPAAIKQTAGNTKS